MGEKQINLGLIGWPLEHSLSPQIHQAALRELGLKGKYCLYAIENNGLREQAITDLLEHVANEKIQGLNVTLPYKQIVLSHMASLTPAAARIGAVNTIRLNKGLLQGENTDAAGFMNDLKELPVASKANTLILGAGGAARAVIFSLLEAGHLVTIAARDPQKAQAVANSFSCIAKVPIRVLPLESKALSAIKDDLDLLINATPLGMSPHKDTCAWPKILTMPKHACVYDLVYTPANTMLIQRAQLAGLPARSGLGMLVEQAALAFESWTKKTAPRSAMYQAAIDSIQKRNLR